MCANRLEVRLDDADAAVLAAVERDVLRVEVLETAFYKAMARPEPNGHEAQGAALRAELARLDAELARRAARSPPVGSPRPRGRSS